MNKNSPTSAAAAAFRATGERGEPFTAPAKRYGATVPWAEVGQALKSGPKVVRQGAADFADFIFRMLRALFQRIARLFGVTVASPGEGSSVPQAEAASFSGARGGQVTDAGLAAATELGRVSDAIRDLMGRDLDAAQLKGEGAEAYARLVLARLCRSLNDIHGQAQGLESDLAVHTRRLARDLGAPESSVLAMLEQAVAGATSTGLGDPQTPEMAAALGLAKRLAESRLDRSELLATMAVHSAAILSAAGDRTAVQAAVWAGISEITDPLARNELAAQITTENVVHSSSSAVHSAKRNESGEDATASKAVGSEPDPALSPSNVLDMDARRVSHSRLARLARFRSMAAHGEENDPGPGSRDRG